MNRCFVSLRAVAILGMFSCADMSPSDFNEMRGTQTSALRLGDRCQEAATVIRKHAIDRMNAELDAAKEEFLSGDLATVACSCPPGAVCSSGSSGGTISIGGVDYGIPETNNQVPGVDEADIVKTDGRYMYTLSTDTLHVIEAWPAANAHEVAKVTLAGKPLKMLLRGQRLVIYVDHSGYGERIADPRAEQTTDPEVHEAVDVATQILVFDVTTPSNPRRVRDVGLSGKFVAARNIGNVIHTVTSQSAAGPLDRVSYQPSYLDQCAPERYTQTEVDLAFEELRQENLAKIVNTELNFPAAEDSADQRLSMTCDEQPYEDMDFLHFTTVVSLDVADETPLIGRTVLVRSPVAYASAEAFYVAGKPQSYRADGKSRIYKYVVGDHASQTRYAAVGEVPGSLIDQYAMDAWQGHLRVASTSVSSEFRNLENAVTILEEQGDRLVVVGNIEHIAPREDIRSVRFDGAHAYVVTFQNIDPLFVLNLASPVAPHVMAELEVPGYSTYIHVMGDTHLLTVGYAPNENGNDSTWQTVIQVFDIQDLNSPKRVQVARLGDHASQTEATMDALAFNYDRSRHLLLLPTDTCKQQNGKIYPVPTFRGLITYHVDADQGIQELGRIAHPLGSELGCLTWTVGGSTVKRSIIMDNFVYTVSANLIKVAHLNALDTVIANIPLVGEGAALETPDAP